MASKSAKLASKKKSSSASSKKEAANAGYKICDTVISRRNQNGTIILMKTYKAISFFKIEGIATEVWRCFETPQTVASVSDHLSEIFEKTKNLNRDIAAFVAKLVDLELVIPVKGPYGTKFPEVLPESLKLTSFGGIQEFNLEKIESEVLNDSLYLDVFAGSDLRLKTEISPIQNALAKVLQLDGITHKWKKGAPVKNPKATRAGLIAQQVAAQMPELVRKDVSGVLAVDYQKLNSYLVESIKELHHMLRQQDEKISKLEAKLKQ